MRSTDDACPKCGCPDHRADSRVTTRTILLDDNETTAEVRQQRRRCEYCQAIWSATLESAEPEVEVVAYYKPRCPKCGGRAHVNGRRGQVRYHLCQDCGATFKSVEVDPPQLRRRDP
jgi:tRNA(Ile2) C34 agmatinyltransferase TiaS